MPHGCALGAKLDPGWLRKSYAKRSNVFFQPLISGKLRSQPSRLEENMPETPAREIVIFPGCTVTSLITHVMVKTHYHNVVKVTSA